MSRQRFFHKLRKPKKRHDPAVNLEHFETQETAKIWLESRIKALRCKGADSIALKLAAELSDCLNRIRRCKSPACPQCARMYRRHITGAIMSALELAGYQTGQGFTATTIPHELACPTGQLDKFDLAKANRAIRRRIERSALTNEIVVGAWDFSLNHHQEGLWEDHWQPHLYLIFPFADDRKQLRKELKRVFPKSETVPKPIWTERFGDPLKQITYAIKWCFFRRCTYTAPNGRHATSGHVGCRRLPKDAESELLVALDQFGWRERMFLRNVRRRGARLVLSPPKIGVRAKESANRG